MQRHSIDTTALLDRIIECNTYDLGQFTSFVIENNSVGWIHKSRLSLLERYPQVFQILPERVVLHPSLDTPEVRTEAVDVILKEWHAQGVISGWRDEKYRVSSTLHAPPYMLIERSAASLFGVLKYGIHINGVVKSDERTKMWIARRSSMKSKFPGRLDQLVAGALPANMHAREMVIRECKEEASIPANLACNAQSTGAIGYCVDHHQSLTRGIIFAYDLELPDTLVPRNADGEVEAFYLWPVERVMETLATTKEFRPICNLVLIDFLIRDGYLNPEDPYYVEIAQGLMGSACMDQGLQQLDVKRAFNH